MFLLGVSVCLPYVTALFLGLTLGKLQVVGPLLRGFWYTTFWLTVVVQFVAIIAFGASYWLPISQQVQFGAVTISGVPAALSLLLLMFMIPAARHDDGHQSSEFDAPAGPSGSSIGLFDVSHGDGEAVLIIVGAVLVFGSAFFLSFFPLRGIARLTARIAHVGILKA